MPAVIAIATAPQTTTRSVAGRRGAPPSRAPGSPSSPRAKRHGHGRDPRAAPAHGDRQQRQDRAGRERQRRRPRGLQRPGEPLLGEAELVARVRLERAVARERLRDLGGQPGAGRAARRSRRARAARPRGSLRSSRSSRRRSACSASRCELTDTYSPGGHRQRAGDQPGDPRRDDRRADAPGRRDAEHEARGRHDAVVGAEHGGAQPVGPVAEVDLPAQAGRACCHPRDGNGGSEAAQARETRDVIGDRHGSRRAPRVAMLAA